jgi:hypothetical protein
MGGNGGIHDELMFAPAALSGSQSKPPVSPEVPQFIHPSIVGAMWPAMSAANQAAKAPAMTSRV